MSLLYHFSEDPNIQAFVPRLHPSHPSLPPAVWAIDEAHAPMYYLPRDCPWIAFRLKEDTSAEDKAYFLDQTQAKMVINVELRLTPSLTPLREFLLPRTLQFSMIRMRNARP